MWGGQSIPASAKRASSKACTSNGMHCSTLLAGKGALGHGTANGWSAYQKLPPCSSLSKAPVAGAIFQLGKTFPISGARHHRAMASRSRPSPSSIVNAICHTTLKKGKASPCFKYHLSALFDHKKFILYKNKTQTIAKDIHFLLRSSFLSLRKDTPHPAFLSIMVK